MIIDPVAGKDIHHVDLVTGKIVRAIRRRSRRCRRLRWRAAIREHDKQNGSRHAPHDERAPPHSITSSVMDSNPDGSVSPSALAVLRLTTSSNLADCTTGKSAGFSP